MELISNMFVEFPDVVGANELQKMLNISRSKAYSLLQSGEIKSKKCGRIYKIKKVNIIKFLEEE